MASFSQMVSLLSIEFESWQKRTEQSKDECGIHHSCMSFGGLVFPQMVSRKQNGFYSHSLWHARSTELQWRLRYVTYIG